jgi:hypothetical protein
LEEGTAFATDEEGWAPSVTKPPIPCELFAGAMLIICNPGA